MAIWWQSAALGQEANIAVRDVVLGMGNSDISFGWVRSSSQPSDPALLKQTAAPYGLSGLVENRPQLKGEEVD